MKDNNVIQYVTDLYNNNPDKNVTLQTLLNNRDLPIEDALDCFFQLLRDNNIKLEFDRKYNSITNIPYNAALKIAYNIDTDADSTFKFGIWLLDSNKMNHKEKQEIRKTIQSKLQNLQVSQELAQSSYNEAMIGMHSNAIILSFLHGADINAPVQMSWDPFYYLTEPVGTISTGSQVAYVSPLIMALSENKPLLVNALLSCGYKITPSDHSELDNNSEFHRSVSECLQQLKPVGQEDKNFMINLLSSVMDCDTTVLEAVYYSPAQEKARDIVSSIEENKRNILTPGLY